MSNPLISIAKIIIPVALVYVSFQFGGPIAGIAALIVVALAYLYLNRSMVYQNKAGKKYMNRDYEGALADLKAAVQAAPKDPKVRGTYAFFLVKMGRTDEAAEEIEKAIEGTASESDRKPLMITRSLILWKQGRLDEAIKVLEELLPTYENTNVYATLGFFYIEKGDYNKALEFNLKAKEFNSSSNVILDNLGTVYFLMGDYDNALEIYESIMKNKPNFPEAFYNYARVLDKKGNLEKALYMVRYSLTLPFWHTSTVKKAEVEAFLNELEAKEKAMEAEKQESPDSIEPIDNM